MSCIDLRLTLSLDSRPQGSERDKGKYPVTTEKNQGNGQPKVERLTPEQVARLELAFRECPFPDARTRVSLSEELGVKPLKVQYWFTYRRKQVRTQEEFRSNQELMQENKHLKKENSDLKIAASNLICSTCSTKQCPPLFAKIKNLEMENSLLRKEINRIKSYMGSLGLMPDDKWNPGSSCSPTGNQAPLNIDEKII